MARYQPKHRAARTIKPRTVAVVGLAVLTAVLLLPTRRAA